MRTNSRMLYSPLKTHVPESPRRLLDINHILDDLPPPLGSPTLPGSEASLSEQPASVILMPTEREVKYLLSADEFECKWGYLLQKRNRHLMSKAQRDVLSRSRTRIRNREHQMLRRQRYKEERERLLEDSRQLAELKSWLREFRQILETPFILPKPNTA